MRKFITIMFAVTLSLWSADKAVLDASKITGYKITGESDSYLELSFNLKDIACSDVSTDKGIFTRIGIDNGYTSQVEGSPALPEFHELIAMPYGAEPEVEIISYDSKVYNLSDLGIKYPVYPAQPSYSKMTEPEQRLFVYNEAAYKAAKFTDTGIAEVTKSGTMRGVGVGMLKVKPFRYDPSTSEIEVLNNIVVKVNYTNAHTDADGIARNEYSPYFESALSQLINYKSPALDTKADLMNWPVTYLIVAATALNGNSDLQRLIDWKTEKGFNVIVNYVATTATISANDTWVESQYSTLSPKPSFVLIVGDADGTYAVQAELDPALGSGGAVCGSDLMYGVIGATGTSNRIPSMYVGRFSVRALGDLTAQVDKVLWYEKEQFTTGYDLNYLTYILGVAGYDSSYGEDYGNPQIEYGWTYYFTSVNGMSNAQTYYCPATSNSAVDQYIVDYVSAGCNFYNYTAHGCNTGLQDPEFYGVNSVGKTNDIAVLANANEYPLVVANCCLTGSFTNNSDYASTYGGADYCFGEQMAVAANKGAIGYIGASMSTYWDEDLVMGVGLDAVSQYPPPQDVSNPGMYDGAMELGYASQAAIKHVGLMAVENYGGTKVDWYWSAYHLFGDPSVMIYYGTPGTMTATHNGAISPDDTEYTITTTPYAYVALSDDSGVLHGAARANSSGVAVVSITNYDASQTGKLVITAQFKQPYFEDIFIDDSGLSSPKVFAASAHQKDVYLSWNAPAKALSSYKVYRNGTSIATTSNTSYIDYNRPEGTYEYYATAVYTGDPSGESYPSNKVSVTVVQFPIPLNFSAEIGDEWDIAALTWDAPFKALIDYDVYRNGSYIATTTNNFYNDEGLSEGTYSYYIKATYDDPGESAATSTLQVEINEPLYPSAASLGFENGGSLPAEWTNEGNWTFVTTSTSPTAPAEGSYFAYFNTTTGYVQKLTTPKFDMHNYEDVTLDFQYCVTRRKSGPLYYYDNLKVYYKDATSKADWVLLASYENQAYTTWQTASIPLDNSILSKDFYIAFEGIDGGGNGASVDDIVINGTYIGASITPGTPSNVVTSISGTDLVIDWDAAANATSYDVYSADDPYGTFTYEANVATNQYVIPYTDSKKFYYVIAKNATK